MSAVVAALVSASGCMPPGDPVNATGSASGSGGIQVSAATDSDCAVAAHTESADPRLAPSPADPTGRVHAELRVRPTPPYEEGQVLGQICGDRTGSVCTRLLEASAPVASIHVLHRGDPYSLDEVLLASGVEPVSEVLWRLGTGAVDPHVEVRHERRESNFVFDIVYSYPVDWTLQYPRVHTWDIQVGCAPTESGWDCGPGRIQRYRSCRRASRGDYCSRPEIEVVFDYQTGDCHAPSPVAELLPTSSWFGGSLILPLGQACPRLVRSSESR